MQGHALPLAIIDLVASEWIFVTPECSTTCLKFHFSVCNICELMCLQITTRIKMQVGHLSEELVCLFCVLVHVLRILKLVLHIHLRRSEISSFNVNAPSAHAKSCSHHFMQEAIINTARACQKVSPSCSSSLHLLNVAVSIWTGCEHTRLKLLMESSHHCFDSVRILCVERVTLTSTSV